MPDLPPSRVGTSLDRLVLQVSAGIKVPPPEHTPLRAPAHDGITLERAKGAVMLRYGVSSHVAFAMIARWSRDADISIATLASALVAAATDPGGRPPIDIWPEHDSAPTRGHERPS